MGRICTISCRSFKRVPSCFRDAISVEGQELGAVDDKAAQILGKGSEQRIYFAPGAISPFSPPSTIMIETLLPGLSGLDHALFEPSENVSFFFYSPNGGVSII